MASDALDQVFVLVREIDELRAERDAMQNQIEAKEELLRSLVGSGKGKKEPAPANPKVPTRGYSEGPLGEAIVRLLDSEPERVFQTKEIAKITARPITSVVPRCAELVSRGKIAKVRPKGYLSLHSTNTAQTIFKIERKEGTASE